MQEEDIQDHEARPRDPAQTWRKPNLFPIQGTVSIAREISFRKKRERNRSSGFLRLNGRFRAHEERSGFSHIITFIRRSLTGRARSSLRILSRTRSLSEIKMEARGWRSRVAALRGRVLNVGKRKDASDEKRHCRDCL